MIKGGKRVLWGYHCTPQSSMQNNPFKLTYDADTMVLVEISEPSLCRNKFNVANNSKFWKIEEVRSEA